MPLPPASSPPIWPAPTDDRAPALRHRLGQHLPRGVAHRAFRRNRPTGYGREGGLDAIHDYTRTKAVWINTSDAPLADPFVLR